MSLRLCKNRGFNWSAVSAVCVLLSVLGCGCGKREQASYEQLRLQLMKDAFAALSQEDSGPSARALQRLQDACPEAAFCQQAIEYEADRETLRKAAVHLQAGELDQAEAVLQRRSPAAVATPPVVRAYAQLAALRALKDYLCQQPFTDAAAATKAWDRLEEHKAVLRHAAGFANWELAEVAGQRKLHEQKLAAASAQLLAECDKAAVGDFRGFNTALANLLEFKPDHPLGVFLKKLPGMDVATLRNLLPATAAAEIVGSVEIAAALTWTELKPASRRELALLLGKHTPATASGLLVRARLAGTIGDRPLALQLVMEASKQTPLGQPQLASLLTEAVAAPEQFNALPWRSPFPAFTDILNRLSHYREVCRLRPGK